MPVTQEITTFPLFDNNAEEAMDLVLTRVVDTPHGWELCTDQLADLVAKL